MNERQNDYRNPSCRGLMKSIFVTLGSFIALALLMCSYLWKFFVDKNRSTAIASILRFVSEFLQSISLAIEFLQSILVRRRVFAIEFLQSIFCNRVFAIEFLQSILVRRRVFAIDLSSSSSFCYETRNGTRNGIRICSN